jgi:dipeptidyl aminopeptidase/acylaminoacyl peptidase
VNRHLTIAIGAGLAAFAAAAAGGYLAVSAFVYNRMSRIEARCGGRFADFTPASFDAKGFPLDTTPYRMPVFEEVSLASRDPGITLRAWWIPAGSDAASTPAGENQATARTPAVILVHGHGACRRDPVVLLPAGMLHGNGFGVLLVDLRNHGDSTIDDGRHAGGTEEYRDLLGAWDWLQAGKGLLPAQVGAWGASMGAATALIAAAEEPGLAAVWADSSFADAMVAARDELTRNRYPTFLAQGGMWIARLISGVDLVGRSPLRAVERLGDRPVFLTHGAVDRRMNVHHALDLAQALARRGERWELWVVPGAGHVEAMFLHPDEYEQKLIAFFRAALTPRAMARAPASG